MKPQPDGKQKRYVTIQDAAELLNIAERTVFRMIEKKRLESMKDSDGSRWVSLDDIERKQQATPRSASPTRYQLKQLQGLVTALQETVQQHEHRILALQQQIESLAFAQAPVPGAALSFPQLVKSVPLSAAEKRGYPTGTQRLVDVASAHHVTVGSIKSLYEAGDIALSVYQRPTNPERNKQEWWITPEQHIALAAYWHAHELPWTTCSVCSVVTEEQEVKEA